MYEELVVENEKLKSRIKEMEENERKKEMEYNKEKRYSSRKISELEEEIKLIENIRQENVRLRDENGALIRVISKLSK